MHSPSFPTTVPQSDASLPSTRSGRSRWPFTGTIKALRLAAVLLRRAWFPSLGATTRRALGVAPAVSKRNHSRPGVLYIRPPLRPTGSGGDDSISQVPEKPLLYLCPVLRLRCDGSLLTLAVRAAWPP